MAYGYDPKIAKKFLDLYASGKTMRKIFEANKDFPSRWSVYRWRKDNPDFDELFILASECFADNVVEEAFDNIKDETDAKRAKLLDVQFKVSTWYAAKINRAKYGDRIDVEHTVKLDISKPLQLAMSRIQSIKPLIEASAKQIE